MPLPPPRQHSLPETAPLARLEITALLLSYPLVVVRSLRILQQISTFVYERIRFCFPCQSVDEIIFNLRRVIFEWLVLVFLSWKRFNSLERSKVSSLDEIRISRLLKLNAQYKRKRKKHESFRRLIKSKTFLKTVETHPVKFRICK